MKTKTKERTGQNIGCSVCQQCVSYRLTTCTVEDSGCHPNQRHLCVHPKNIMIDSITGRRHPKDARTSNINGKCKKFKSGSNNSMTIEYSRDGKTLVCSAPF